jgi:hypothetical protein
MANIFDSMQLNLQRTINTTFGYMVEWTPSIGGGEKRTAKCLFQAPTKKYEVGSVDFTPTSAFIEYIEGDMPGLYEFVARNQRESLMIYEIGADPSTAVEYFTMERGRMWDGKIYRINIDSDQAYEL